jgi:hypothetical protein
MITWLTSTILSCPAVLIVARQITLAAVANGMSEKVVAGA